MSRFDMNKMPLYTMGIYAPETNSIEELELYHNAVSDLEAHANSVGGYQKGMIKNTPVQSEKQIAMRLRLRKKLEKKKSQKK